MTPENPALPAGYSPLPPGHIATVVTYLEMTAQPPQPAAPAELGRVELRPLPRDDVAGYRALFRAVGEDWLWTSRLMLDDAQLSSILRDPAVEPFALMRGGKPAGLLELDFREAGECELGYFGLVPDAVGQGLGRRLMHEALARVWAKPIRRLWLHTCSLDHPAALAFYRRAGFTPYAFAVEVLPDPRLAGLLPRTAAPQVPLLET